MIEKLMNEFSAIPKAYDVVARLTGENFNIFQILKLGSREVETHSAFLGELLNCKGTHGQNNLFLELFMKRLGIVNLDSNTSELFLEHNAGTITEEEGGRIDIFICDKQNNCIIIENKIYAYDQKNQLVRYHNYGKKRKSKKLLYLTLWGGKPEPFSTGNLIETDYQCISYQIDILNWLYDCQKEATNFPILRESISQYINLIKLLTHQTSSHKMSNEIVQGILSSPDKLEAYLTLIGNTDVENKVYANILEDFEKQLAEVGKELNLKFTFGVDRSCRYSGFGFENDVMNKYNICIGFNFDQKNTRGLIFGFNYVKNELFADAPNKIIQLFDQKFSESTKRQEYWLCYILHEHINWETDTYVKVKNGEMAETIKTQVKKMLEIVASIDENGTLHE